MSTPDTHPSDSSAWSAAPTSGAAGPTPPDDYILYMVNGRPLWAPTAGTARALACKLDASLVPAECHIRVATPGEFAFYRQTRPAGPAPSVPLATISAAIRAAGDHYDSVPDQTVREHELIRRQIGLRIASALTDPAARAAFLSACRLE